MSKKEKKRQKLAAKHGGEEGSAVKEEEKKNVIENMGELIFKASSDFIAFEAQEIFKEPEIALGVCESKLNEVFELSPKKLLIELRKLAEQRYKYTLLPKKLHQIKCLDT